MTGPSRVILAIDQGTTATTALVLDEEARVVGSAREELPQSYPRPGWVEHDPEQIWASVLRVAEAARLEAGVGLGAVAGVGITNQRETTVVWDRRSGVPVHAAIVWQDRRSVDVCRRLEADGLADLFRQRTGLKIDPYFSATKLAWLLEHLEGLRGRAMRGELAFGTVDSWLAWKLTGGAAHVTDATNASRTMLMDLSSTAWDEELCALVGVPPEVLPEICPSSGIVGESVPGTLGDRCIPVAGLLGDQQSALFAQACFEPGQTKNTYGTGSFVLQHAGTTVPASNPAVLRTVAYRPGDGPTEYALEGSIFATGAAVQWLRDGLGIISDAAETAGLAASLDGNDDVWFVPALTGLGSPQWDPFARGTLLGVTRGTTRAHLARAVLESIAYQTRDVLEVMSEGRRGPEELRVDGGAAVNGWLMQFQADVLGIPVDVAAVTETTSLGAGYAAGLAVGLWRTREELREHRRTGRRYEPQMAASERDALFARWQQAVERSRTWAVPAHSDIPGPDGGNRA